MNTTVRTRRSGSRPAPADGSSPGTDRPAASRTLSRRPARQQTPSQQAPSQQAPSRSAPGRPARTTAGQPAPGAVREGTSAAGPGRRATAPPVTGRAASGVTATTRTATERPAARRSPRPAGAATDQVTAAAPVQRSRTPFILLVVGLLAGGLVCLLVVNTTLAAGSYQIGKLQQDNTAQSQRVQQLQQQVSAEESPASIQQRALRLGMRQQPVLNFVDLRTGLTYSTAAKLPPIYDVPGYAP